MTYKLTFHDEGLASRHAAAVKRLLIEAEFDSNCPVVLNLSAVRTISSSYADEFFGVLAQSYGLLTFVRLTTFIGANPAVLNQIATAIKYRLARSSVDLEQLAREAQKVKSARRCGESA